MALAWVKLDNSPKFHVFSDESGRSLCMKWLTTPGTVKAHGSDATAEGLKVQSDSCALCTRKLASHLGVTLEK